jgi:hypothetical protein
MNQRDFLSLEELLSTSVVETLAKCGTRKTKSTTQPK